MVPPPWRGARSLLPLNVSSNSKSKAWVFPLVSSFGHCPVYVSGFVHNHWAFNIILQSSTNWPTISIIWLMSPVDWVDVRMYGLISFTLFVVRTLEYVLQISRGPGTGIQCVTTTSYSPTAGLWLLNASGFLWGQGPGKGGTGGDRLVPWRNYLLEIDIDTLLVLVGSSGNTEIRSIAFRHTLHLYLYMYIYIYTIYILWNEIIQNLQMYKYLYIVSLDIYFQSIYLSIYLSI